MRDGIEIEDNPFGPEDGLTTATWFAQLSRLAPWTDYESLIPWNASSSARCTFAIAELGHHGGPAGWEIAYLPTQRLLEVRMPGFAPGGRRARLRELLAHASMPDARVALIGGPCWQPTDDDAAVLAASGRDVTLAPARGR